MQLIDDVDLVLKPEAARRRHWDNWDVMREFVQNALDAGGDISVNKVGDVVTIEDKGKGFDVTAFLFGETTKDPKCDRGQFGDGLKYACLTAAAKGYVIDIYSKGYLYKPVLKKREYVVGKRKRVSRETLHIEQYEASKVKGTKIVISNYKGELYRENFILYDDNDREDILFNKEQTISGCESGDKKYHSCIMSAEGKGRLYVKDIFVSDEDETLFSYNLITPILTVDRKLSYGYEKSIEIAELWASVPLDMVAHLAVLLSSMTKFNSYESRMDWNWSSVRNLLESNWDVWKIALNLAYPNSIDEEGNCKFMCYYDSDEAKLAEYYSRNKYGILPLPKTMLGVMNGGGLIKSAGDIIAEYMSNACEYLDKYDVSEEEAMRFDKALEVMRVLIEDKNTMERLKVDFERLKYFNVRIMKHELPDVLGQWEKDTRTLGINVSRLSSIVETIETLCHELVHVLYDSDYESNSTEFTSHLVAILAEVVGIIANGKVIFDKDFKW